MKSSQIHFDATRLHWISSAGFLEIITPIHAEAESFKSLSFAVIFPTKILEAYPQNTRFQVDSKHAGLEDDVGTSL